jgi:N-glycosylase/DNA lyase
MKREPSPQTHSNRYRGIRELKTEFLVREDALRQRIAEFAAVRPTEYFYELVYCLLTPQSTALNAGKAVEKLKMAGFVEREIEPARVLAQKDSYIRFHHTKGRYLKEAKRLFADIQAMLGNGHDGPRLREWLVENVKGLGWKEASHFLRNIGYHNLAILDRHILKNLHYHGVIRSLPKSLTPRRYRFIEKKFQQFAAAVGISLDELDLLFWSRETGEILK